MKTRLAPISGLLFMAMTFLLIGCKTGSHKAAAACESRKTANPINIDGEIGANERRDSHGNKIEVADWSDEKKAACLFQPPLEEKPSTPPTENEVLMVGVDWDGTPKQQVVHAYKSRDLKDHALVVGAGATLTILESVDGASRVHFLTDAKTPDYKTTIPQVSAIGWIKSEEVVHISKTMKHLGAIRQYLETVDLAILAELPNGKIDRMAHSPWQDDMRKQVQHKGLTGLGLELWSETQPADHFVRMYVRCNILGTKQLSFASIGPTLTIQLPEQDIRLEWYIHTGSQSLDEKIIAIIKEKAKTFQKPGSSGRNPAAHP